MEKKTRSFSRLRVFVVVLGLLMGAWMVSWGQFPSRDYLKVGMIFLALFFVAPKIGAFFTWALLRKTK